MKNLQTRILSVLLSAACAASVAVSAGGSLTASAAGSLPAKFDLRNVDGINFVTPVRNQNPWGSCWAFGTTSAAEISIQYEIWKEHGITPQQNPIDFSELATTWFAGTPLPAGNPIAPEQANEGNYVLHEYSENDRLNTGGFNYYTLSQYAAGIGPFFEDEAPYRCDDGLVVWFLYDADGNPVLDEEGMQIFELKPIDWAAPEGYRPEFYSPISEWSVAESLRSETYPSLESAKYLPCPAVINDDYSYDYQASATEMMKEELINGRAISVSFCADTYLPNQPESEPLYLSDNFAHYTYDPTVKPNHEVCIIGWDDNYSRSNFLQGVDDYGDSKTPPADGAWIVKNSWGGNKNEFPDYFEWGIEGEGYFYLSYYDKSLSDPVCYDFNVESFLPDGKKTPMLINQYDLMPVSWYQLYDMAAADLTSPVKTANVFKANQNQLLTFVSTIAAAPNVNVKYEIYRLKEGYQNPSDGELLKEFEKNYTASGYYREPLDPEVPIAAGETYSIVVTQSNDYGYYHTLGMAVSKKLAEFYDQMYQDMGMGEYDGSYAIGVVNQGESWLFLENEWTDETEIVPIYGKDYLIDEETGETEDFEDAYACDNYPIKGYSFKGDEIKCDISAVAEQNGFEAGGSVKFKVTVTNPSDKYTVYGVHLTNDFGTQSEDIKALAPKQSAEFEVTYSVKDTDVANGKIDVNFMATAAYAAEGTVFKANAVLEKAGKEPERTEPVSVADAVKLARFVAEDPEITGISVANSDYNKDGKLTNDDVRYLLAKIAKLDKPCDD